MAWTHTYREGALTPNGTITGTRPGKRIALAITELQQKSVNDVIINPTGGVQAEARIVNNQLIIDISVDAQESTTPGDTLPTEGLPGQVLTFSDDGNHFWDWVRAVEVP